MAKKKLEDFTTEELLSKKKTLKVVMYMLLGLIIVYAVFMFYQMFTGTWDTSTPLIVMPMMLFVILLPIRNSQKMLDDELKKREAS